VKCLTIDLYGQRLTVKSSRYIDLLGYYVYALEDEKGQQVYRGNHVSSEIPEHFLQSAEGVLERYIRLTTKFFWGDFMATEELSNEEIKLECPCCGNKEEFEADTTITFTETIDGEGVSDFNLNQLMESWKLEDYDEIRCAKCQTVIYKK